MFKAFEKINNFILKNLLFLILIIVLLYIFVGFGGPKTEIMPADSYAMANERMMMANDSAPMMMKSAAGFPMNSAQKVTKSYNLSIEVKSTDKIKSFIDSEIVKVEGVVDNFNSYLYSGNDLAYNYSLRIPSKNIEESIKYFKTLGIIKSESSSANDATERYEDNSNRLKNLYVRRDRLRKMMESKTEKLNDILAVDRELINVQSQIESLENANKKIDTNVLYSRLDLSVLPEIKFEDFNNSVWRVDNSWKIAVNDLIVFGQKSVDFGFKLIVFLPVIIVVVIIFFGIKRIFRKKEK